MSNNSTVLVHPPLASKKTIADLAKNINRPKTPEVTASQKPLSNAEIFSQEVMKFVNRDVVVDYIVGIEIRHVEGRLASWNFHNHHIVVDTKTHSVFVRSPLSVTRRRKGAVDDIIANEMKVRE